MASEASTAPPPHPLSAIGKGPWETALFTTYAFSPAFFDTEVLPRLAHARCNHTLVLVDVAGVRASLMERQSLTIGTQYELIPVAHRRGVFHPKCLYLAARETDGEDRLVIGSGNLTFGGQGGNVEVCEVLSSRVHGAVFVAFADFLETLCATPQVELAHAKPVLELAKRARTHAATASPDGPHLLHTVNADALTQFAALAAPVKPHTLTVVSPFHHHEGAPVRTLVETLGVATLKVVVAGTTTSFPFDLTQGWRAPAVPVRLPGEERRLHAKWYEAKGDERLVVLTGSVNATHMALKSNDNIEVGLVRTLPLEAALQVEALAAPPMFEADVWEPGRGSAVVAARLMGSDMDGRLFDANAPAGTWEVTLHGPARVPQPPVAVTVDDVGAFVTTLPYVVDPEAGSVEVRLARGDELARGWVQFPLLLREGVEERVRRAQQRRLQQGTATADDLAEFLRFMQAHAVGLLADEPEYSGAPKKREAREPSTTTVRAETLGPGYFDDTKQRGGSAAFGLTGLTPAQQAATLVELFLGRNPETGRPVGRPAPPDEPDDADTLAEGVGSNNKPPPPPPPERPARTLEDFEAALKKALDKALRGKPGPSSAAMAQLFEQWCAAALGIRVWYMRDLERARAGARVWLLEVTHLPYLARVLPRLDELVVGVSLTLMANAKGQPIADPFLRQLGNDPGSYYQRLESYFAGPVDVTLAQALLAEFLTYPTNAAFADAAAGELSRLLARWSRRRTPASELRRLLAGKLNYATLRRHEARRVKYGLPTVFRATELELLRQKPTQVARVMSCPCHCALGGDDQTRLKRRHLVQCPNCKRVLVYV